VWFDRLSDKKIESYLDTEEYKDKAGAYGIQDKGALLVKRIEGCFFNVMGLPVNLLEEMFNKLGRSFLDDAK
jgi:septum formation protein